MFEWNLPDENEEALVAEELDNGVMCVPDRQEPDNDLVENPHFDDKSQEAEDVPSLALLGCVIKL